jgi:hypothetical protein
MPIPDSPKRRGAQAGRLPHEHFLRAWARQVVLAHCAIFPGPCEARDDLELFADLNPLLGLGPTILADKAFDLLNTMAARAPVVTARLRQGIRIERKSVGAAR